MSRRSPAPPGARVPLWTSLATLPGRVWLTLALLWHRPRPSAGVLDRLSRRGHRPRDARGSHTGRR